jgi:hypothetical protein
MRTHLPTRFAVTASCLVAAVTVAAAQASQSASSPVKVQPSPAVVGKASAPPPATGKQQTPSIGKQASAKPSDSPTDTDSFWIETIDIDGDGNTDTADLLWDDEDRVLFLHDEGPFTCQSGGQGEGEMLVAIYGTGNARNQPVGSGWYVVGLDAGECGAKAAGLFGCRFDAKGNTTACGAAVVKDDEVSIGPGQ